MKLAFFAAAAAALLASPAGAATLLNGSFEMPDISGGFQTLNAGSSALEGWTIDEGSVDLINSHWQPQDGGQSLDLNGNAQGKISQMITDLVVDATYELSFWVSGNPDGAPQKKNLHTIFDDGTPIQVIFDTFGISRSAMKWQRHTVLFTAVATEMKLTFASGDAGFYGTALDNVSVEQVPVPAAGLLLLLGLGGLAGLRLRRG